MFSINVATIEFPKNRPYRFGRLTNRNSKIQDSAAIELDFVAKVFELFPHTRRRSKKGVRHFFLFVWCSVHSVRRSVGRLTWMVFAGAENYWLNWKRLNCVAVDEAVAVDQFK